MGIFWGEEEFRNFEIQLLKWLINEACNQR